MATITLDTSDFDKFARAMSAGAPTLRKEIEKAVKLSTLKIERESAKEAPVNKEVGLGGRLRSSIKSKVSKFKGEVFPTVNYGKAVHDGTKPHTVAPKSKPFLAFKIGGRWIYTRKPVFHPGTKANPYLERGIKKSEKKIGEIFKQSIDRAFTKIFKKQ